MDNIEIINALNLIDLSSYPYNVVNTLVSQFHPKMLRVTISPGQVIERMRPDIGVFERKDVSYRPAEQNVKPQRATLPLKTAFYGTLCHEEESLGNMRYIALLEASQLYKIGITTNGTEYYTLSRWITNQPLKLAVCVHESVFNGNNNKLLVMSKHEWLKGKSFLDNPLQFDEYSSFVTQQFAKPVTYDYEYIISATIAEKLMYASNVDGVMYPSVQAAGEYGMNVAIRPDVADEKLVLTDIHEMKYEQEAGIGNLRFSKKGMAVEMDSHGIKRWKYTEML